MKKWLFGLIVLGGMVTGCDQKEMDDLSLAQQCLDNVPQSNPIQANGCLQFTAGYSDQQAMLMNCEIELTAGGLTTDRMASAFEITLNAGVAHNAADYMAYLAFTTYNPDVDTAYTQAQTAQNSCNQSGDTGLQFVANLAVVGSLANKFVTGGAGFNLNDTAANIDSAMNTALSHCATTPMPGDCDPNVIAPSIISTASSYCSLPSADQTVCTSVTTAVSQFNTSPATLTQAMMCILQHKTFNPVGPTCT